MIKINSLELENVKRIRALALTPSDSGLTIIGGDNNQGKTSVLDAIAWALGGDRMKPTDPAREGSVVPPYINIKLSNGLIVERKGKNSELKITDPMGRKGGQQLLNEFVETFALDLPRFIAQTSKEKANTLLKIIGVGDKLYELERAEKEAYNERLTIGRIAEQKEAFAREMPYYADAPREPVAASELIRRQQNILAQNGENQRKRARAAQLEHQKQELRRQLDELQERYDAVCRDCDIAARSAAELLDESTEALEMDIANIEQINIKVRANLDKDKADTDARMYQDQYAVLTDKVNSLRRQKMDLLSGADLPLPGLSVEDGDLTYNGRKWDCMSSSEQLRVSTAIVRKLNPQCGFVLLDRLEQMDVNTLRDFGAWLEAEGLQAIATRVSTGGECSVIIEDGYAVGSSAPAPQPQPQPQPAKTWKEGQF